MEGQTLIYFWCRYCRHDIKLVGERGKGNSSWGEEVWRAKCPKCKRTLRRGINNPYEPYYRLSLQVRRDRKRFADDLLQPGDPRFDLLYPQHKKKKEAYYEEQQRKNGK